MSKNFNVGDIVSDRPNTFQGKVVYSNNKSFTIEYADGNCLVFPQSVMYIKIIKPVINNERKEEKMAKFKIGDIIKYNDSETVVKIIYINEKYYGVEWPDMFISTIIIGCDTLKLMPKLQEFKFVTVQSVSAENYEKAKEKVVGEILEPIYYKDSKFFNHYKSKEKAEENSLDGKIISVYEVGF